ncbi:MAG: molybdopterin-guanine dinucleotide biosynthesis protein B [Candidatus Hodarchaeota archaeon]
MGYKDSGKTTVTAHIITHLSQQNLGILSAKHVGDPQFSLDTPGTDSYRHLEAGASATFLQSESSTTLLFQRPIVDPVDLLRRGTHVVSADVIVLEGFRFWTQTHPKIAKIICVRSSEEIAKFQTTTTGPILGQCSLDPNIEAAVHIPNELPFLLEAIDKWLPTAPRIKLGESA